jgi:alginate O-acetyltransferase complex protein AlgI
MSFISPEFIAFILVCAIVYFCVPKRGRWIVLLVSSYMFYLFSGFIAFFFILFTTVSTFYTGKFLGRANEAYAALPKEELSREEKKKLKSDVQKKKRRILVAALLANFGILAFIKYFDYGMNLIDSLFHTTAGRFDLIMPLGISFYTFQSMGYLIDVYRGKVDPDKNIYKFALFVSFFPQIVQGPISRYDELAHQLFKGHAFDWDRVKNGGLLILWGFFKKMVIADRVAIVVNQVFSNYTEYQGLTIVFSVVMYTLQIYADFSGGMDVARGTAQMFGIGLANNFKRPYFARTVPEFWRRWHITLGTWCRDYIFYPLSLSKAFGRIGKKSRKLFGNYIGKLMPVLMAQMIVFITIGIWHGSSFKYVAFGIYYGILIILGILFEPVFANIMKKFNIKTNNFSWKLFQILRTFSIVCIGRYFSRAATFTTAISMMKASLNDIQPYAFYKHDLFNLGLDTQQFIILAFAVIVLFAISVMQEKGIQVRNSLEKQNIVFRWTVYFALIFGILLLAAPGISSGEFIYEQF